MAVVRSSTAPSEHCMQVQHARCVSVEQMKRSVTMDNKDDEFIDDYDFYKEPISEDVGGTVLSVILALAVVVIGCLVA